jgi:hypothetical protein
VTIAPLPRRLSRSCGLLLVSLSLLWTATPAQAAALGVPRAQPGGDGIPAFGLGISPARLVVPPDTLTQPHQIEVLNTGSTPLDIVVEKSDFTADRSGGMVLTPQGPNSAVNWITTDVDHFTLAPQKTRMVTFRITTPNGPEPGDHMAALIFVVPAAPSMNNLRINRAVAAPVYVTVPGAVDTTTTVDSLHAPGFAMGGPITIDATLSDTGNTHRDFRGTTPLTAISGGRTIRFSDVTVLRGATVDASAVWADPPLFCFCRVTVSIPNGSGASAHTVMIVIIPVVWIAVVLGIAALAVLGFWLYRRRGRSSGRHAGSAA